jgi:hypothetical protein
VATILVVLIGGGRWLLGRQLITGQSPLAAGRPAPGKARSAPGARRPAVDSWADDNPFDVPAPPPSAQTGPTPRQGTGPAPRQGTGPAPRQGTGPAPRQGAPNGTRPPRDQRTDRDPWGDPRLPADRSQPQAAPRTRPADQGRQAPSPPPPAQPKAQPRDRTPRPSWNPASSGPPRPPRRQPPEGWTQR